MQVTLNVTKLLFRILQIASSGGLLLAQGVELLLLLFFLARQVLRFPGQAVEFVLHARSVDGTGLTAQCLDPPRCLQEALVQHFNFRPGAIGFAVAFGALHVVLFKLFLPVGNRAVGDRLSSICPSPAYEAAFTVLLLAPSIPLLFMGEEWAASSPFLYFCDFDDERLQQAIFEHRIARRRNVARSADGSTLRWDEQAAEPHARVTRRYRELLSLRTREITPRLPQARAGEYEIEGRHLTVHWDLGDATLGLELNAGDVAVDVTAGDRVLATTSNATRRLPRWGALWWLRDG